MKKSYKPHIIEMYHKKVCKHFRIKQDDFFLRIGEPGYEKKLKYARDIFMYLCHERKIQQKEVMDFFKNNGLQYYQSAYSVLLMKIKIRVAEDEDIAFLVNMLK
jgi:hypothetical protein